ncbi:MAG: hypothetical protein AABY22_31400, partial [Nanoarchaeota archaeon]
YIRSPMFDAHNLDKEIENYDPLKDKFKLLEAKMNAMPLLEINKEKHVFLLESDSKSKENK